jgi:hypothetical protein
MIERQRFRLFCGRGFGASKNIFRALLTGCRDTRSKPSFIWWLRKEQDWWEMRTRTTDEETTPLFISHHQHGTFPCTHIGLENLSGDNLLILASRKQSYSIGHS